MQRIDQLKRAAANCMEYRFALLQAFCKEEVLTAEPARHSKVVIVGCDNLIPRLNPNIISFDHNVPMGAVYLGGPSEKERSI